MSLGFSDSHSAWIDRIAQIYCSDPYRDEVARARREYAALCGRPIDEDAEPEILEEELAAFLHWYVLERELDGASPLFRFLRESPSLTEEDRELLLGLLASHRSVFSIEQLRPEVLLRDVLLHGQWRLLPSQAQVWPDSVEGQLIEARLVASEAGCMTILGAALPFASEAREAVLGYCERQLAEGTARRDILWELRRRRTKAERYRHLPASRFFTS